MIKKKKENKAPPHPKKNLLENSISNGKPRGNWVITFFIKNFHRRDVNVNSMPLIIQVLNCYTCEHNNCKLKAQRAKSWKRFFPFPSGE